VPKNDVINAPIKNVSSVTGMEHAQKGKKAIRIHAPMHEWRRYKIF